MPDLSRPARLAGLVNVACGVVMATYPRQTARAAGGRRSRTPDDRIVRALGLRQAVQGVVTVVDPSPAVLILGAVVDVSHAVSMMPVIAGWSGFRRLALVSATVATASAGVAAALAQRSDWTRFTTTTRHRI